MNGFYNKNKILSAILVNINRLPNGSLFILFGVYLKRACPHSPQPLLKTFIVAKKLDPVMMV